MQFDRRCMPLERHPIAPGMLDTQLADLSRRIATQSTHGGGVVTCPSLRVSARAVLENLGGACADARGHLHRSASESLVHRDAGTNASSLRRVTPGLGRISVRAVQTILQTPAGAPVQLGQLAAQTELSVSQTHAVVSLLEEAGLTRSTGKGPGRRRTIPDRTELLDWLAAQPPARRRERRLDVSLYARHSEELWRRASTMLTEAGIAHAVSGAVGGRAPRRRSHRRPRVIAAHLAGCSVGEGGTDPGRRADGPRTQPAAPSRHREGRVRRMRAPRRRRGRARRSCVPRRARREARRGPRAAGSRGDSWLQKAVTRATTSRSSSRNSDARPGRCRLHAQWIPACQELIPLVRGAPRCASLCRCHGRTLGRASASRHPAVRATGTRGGAIASNTDFDDRTRRHFHAIHLARSRLWVELLSDDGSICLVSPHDAQV